MAEFESKIYPVEVEPHPNADRLDIARVGLFNCIIGKGSMQTGDLGAYIPEGSIVPDWLIAEMGLEGRLAGKDKNRVKAIKLRGVLSQGLVYPLVQDGEDGLLRVRVQNGQDVTELLGLKKYEPPVPAGMDGAVWNAFGRTLKYDIEPLKKFPSAFDGVEQVAFTEKLHGTWCCLGWSPSGPEAGDWIVASKGMSAKGLAFDLAVEASKANLYVRAFERHVEVLMGLKHAMADEFGAGTAWYVLGEVFGPGVQDLHYGLNAPGFRAFDVYVGRPTLGRFLPWSEVEAHLSGRFPMVPMIYGGPFDMDLANEFAEGKSTLADHVREGIVIRPMYEELKDEMAGRLILKHTGEGYLLRKGGTEYA